MDRDYVKKFIGDLKSGVPDARVIEVTHSNHYLFMSDQA